jgi:hypothetical protein
MEKNSLAKVLSYYSIKNVHTCDLLAKCLNIASDNSYNQLTISQNYVSVELMSGKILGKLKYGKYTLRELYIAMYPILGKNITCVVSYSLLMTNKPNPQLTVNTFDDIIEIDCPLIHVIVVYCFLLTKPYIEICRDTCIESVVSDSIVILHYAFKNRCITCNNNTKELIRCECTHAFYCSHICRRISRDDHKRFCMSEQARLDNPGLRYLTNEDFRVKYLNLKKCSIISE